LAQLLFTPLYRLNHHLILFIYVIINTSESSSSNTAAKTKLLFKRTLEKESFKPENGLDVRRMLLELVTIITFKVRTEEYNLFSNCISAS